MEKLGYSEDRLRIARKNLYRSISSGDHALYENLRPELQSYVNNLIKRGAFNSTIDASGRTRITESEHYPNFMVFLDDIKNSYLFSKTRDFFKRLTKKS